MEKIPKIVKAVANPDFTMDITFDNKIQKKFVFKDDIDRFQEICDSYEIFSSFKIENTGFAISWNDEIDVSENELWIKGELIT